jgi:hypothetical protein
MNCRRPFLNYQRTKNFFEAQLVTNKKERMLSASLFGSILSGKLPDLREGHVGVEVFESGFVPAFHICQLGKEEFLLRVS